MARRRRLKLYAAHENVHPDAWFHAAGHSSGGVFDMLSSDRFLGGELDDDVYSADAIAESLTHLPKLG